MLFYVTAIPPRFTIISPLFHCRPTMYHHHIAITALFDYHADQSNRQYLYVYDMIINKIVKRTLANIIRRSFFSLRIRRIGLR